MNGACHFEPKAKDLSARRPSFLAALGMTLSRGILGALLGLTLPYLAVQMGFDSARYPLLRGKTAA